VKESFPAYRSQAGAWERVDILENVMASPDKTEQFVQLVTQYQQRVHLFILSLVPNRADADEILQETNLVLWRKFDEFRPGSDFRAWAFQVAFHKIKSFQDRHGRQRLRFGESVMERLASVATAVPDRAPAAMEALDDCKEQLSPQDRDLIERRYQPGATVASVAAEVERSVAAVYKAVVRIRRALYDCIQLAIRREQHQ
jgi:RNA polymerase sigma-70 factor, ECF subfamily